MEQIVEAKSILKTKELLSIFAESIYDPTEERVNNRADKYINDPNTEIFAYKNNDTYKGIIVFDISNIKEIITKAIIESVMMTTLYKAIIGICKIIISKKFNVYFL